MQLLNDPWPWSGTLHGQPLTLADLIERGTLTPEVVAILAWTIAHGASVFAAAGPQGAGKSTVANALLELLPEDAQVYVTAGPRDRLELPSSISSPTYLLVNELSAHMSVYLSGSAVQRAFALLNQGVRMFGTLHARTTAEAASVLYAESNRRPAELDLARVAPFGDSIDAAIRAQRKTVVRFAQPALERLHVQSGHVEPRGILIGVEQREISETRPGPVTGEDLVDVGLEVVPAQIG